MGAASFAVFEGCDLSCASHFGGAEGVAWPATGAPVLKVVDALGFSFPENDPITSSRT